MLMNIILDTKHSHCGRSSSPQVQMSEGREQPAVQRGAGPEGTHPGVLPRAPRRPDRRLRGQLPHGRPGRSAGALRPEDRRQRRAGAQGAAPSSCWSSRQRHAYALLVRVMLPSLQLCLTFGMGCCADKYAKLPYLFCSSCNTWPRGLLTSRAVPRLHCPQIYRFDRLYDHRSTQEEVYEDLQPLTRSVMDGERPLCCACCALAPLERDQRCSGHANSTLY